MLLLINLHCGSVIPTPHTLPCRLVRVIRAIPTTGLIINQVEIQVCVIGANHIQDGRGEPVSLCFLVNQNNSAAVANSHLRF
jgi:hypothetical protein